MSIDINGISSPKVHASTDDSKLKQAVERLQSVKTKFGQSSAADTVSLSDNEVKLAQFDNVAIDPQVVDAKRVAAMKDAISSGSYEIDTEIVANKLMQFESIMTSEK